MPRLFVVIPFWNCEPLLRACLASLASQSVGFTAVVIDDASGPGAAMLARGWCGQGERRWLLRNATNTGPAGARQLGLSRVLEASQSEQDVVVLLDGDDELAHERALEVIGQVYEREPEVQMTLGSHRRSSGRPPPAKRYERWHFDWRLTDAVSWRAHHPRSFRVGLLRRQWNTIRWRWPSGGFIRTGTDAALLLPLLRALEWHQLRQLSEVLYVYHDVRPDGKTLARSPKTRALQLAAEAYVRRSAWWLLAAPPRMALYSVTRRLKRALTPSR